MDKNMTLAGAVAAPSLPKRSRRAVVLGAVVIVAIGLAAHANLASAAVYLGAPVYVYPPPAVIYAPRPVYVPPPVYVAPVYVAPAPAPVAVAPSSTCHAYQTTVTVGGVPRQVYGTACRQPDGSWRIVG
jgi:hypothetical protein